MKPAGDRVAPPTKLTPGVEHGHHRLQGRGAGYWVDLNGYPPAVIGDRYPIILEYCHLHPIATAGHRLIDAVINDLIYQVMKPTLTGAPDIHSRAPPHRLHSAQHLDVLSGVFAVTILVLFYLIINSNGVLPSKKKVSPQLKPSFGETQKTIPELTVPCISKLYHKRAVV